MRGGETGKNTVWRRRESYDSRMAGFGDNPFSLFGGIPLSPPTKRSVFVSYHHDGDQPYYEYFAKILSDAYQIIRDNSLRDEIWSDDADYVMRRIREDYLTGTSCTIVLCGKESHRRKFVDWEIIATLDKQHGLIGVRLPTNASALVPARFLDNYQSGYAVWTAWEQLFQNRNPNVAGLRQAIEAANRTPKRAIQNNRELKS